MTNGRRPPPPAPRLPAREGHAHLTPEPRYTCTRPQVYAVTPTLSLAWPAASFYRDAIQQASLQPHWMKGGREGGSLCNSPARPNARPRLCRVSSLAYLPGLCLPGSPAFHPFILPARLPHLPPAYIYLYHLLPPPRVPLIPPPASSPSLPLYRHSSPGNTASLTSAHPLLCFH